ncbi:MAG: hypothetical protein GTO02_13795 [Candidatus Dadabacteria bacterium]|nr:hypothetical protein [Candidatus Dadabacteria bacterium]
MKNYILKLLNNIILTSITIILFFYLIDVSIYDYFSEPVTYSESRVTHVYDENLINTYFILHDINIVENVFPFTVTGRIRNIDVFNWAKIDIRLDYFVNDMKLGSCTNNNIATTDHYGAGLRGFKPFEPGDSFFFSFVCYDGYSYGLTPMELPDGFRYKLSIIRGLRIKES